MRIRIAGPIACAAAFIALASVGVVSTVQAQGSGSRVQFFQTDVREAIRQVFKTVNRSYSISPNVRGTVTMDMTGTFESMLNALLRQVDATYRIEGGVYEIIPNTPTKVFISGPDPTDNSLIVRGQSGVAMVGDDRYLYVLTQNSVVKMAKADLKVVKTSTLP